MVNVTVFSKRTGCGQCLITKTHLRNKGVEFEEIILDDHPDWVARLRAEGFLGAPVVLVGDEDVWGGYSGDSIDEWAKEFAAAA